MHNEKCKIEANMWRDEIDYFKGYLLKYSHDISRGRSSDKAYKQIFIPKDCWKF